MASRGLGQLTLDLVIKMGGFTAPLNKAERELNTKTRAMESRARSFAKNLNSAFNGLALKLGAAVGGFFAVSKGIDAFFSSIDRADKMRDLSIQLGIGVERLSALAYAASQTGVDLEEFASALKFLEKNAAAALDPKSSQRGLFDAILGEGKADLANTEHLLNQLADAFQKMGDSPHQAALELELFSKSGIKMAEYLRQGSVEIKTLTDRAKELGVVISQDAADGADRFNDKLTDLKAVSEGLKTQLATALMPQVEALLDWAIKFGSDPGNVEKLVKDTTAAFNDLATSIGQLATVGGQVFGALDTLKAKLNSLEKAGQNAALSLYDALAPDGTVFQRLLDENRNALNGQGSVGLNGVYTPNSSSRTTSARGLGGARATNAPAVAPEADAAQQARIAAYLRGNTEDTNKNAAAKSAAAAAAREQADRERELAEQVKKAAEAQAEFAIQLEDLVAQQGGPLAESQLRYRREEEKLVELHKASSIPIAEELAQAINLLHEARDKDAEAIRKSLDTGGERLKQMQQELDLLNMTSQAERDRAAFLLDNPTATGDQADEAVRILKETDATRQAISAMDDFRASATDAFASFLDGSKSAKEAFEDLAKSILAQIAQMLAKKWVEQLFGQQGTTGQGAAGGFMSSLFGNAAGSAKGNLFQNGSITPFARGGIVHGPTVFPMRNGMGLMGEAGPEAVMPLARDAQGRLGVRGGGGITVVQNFSGFGKLDERSASQMQQRSGEKAQRALARNR